MLLLVWSGLVWSDWFNLIGSTLLSSLEQSNLSPGPIYTTHIYPWVHQCSVKSTARAVLININLSTARCKAGNSDQNVFSIFFHCERPATVTQTGTSSRTRSTDHITKNFPSITCSFRNSCVGFFIAMIYKACAFFALSVTYDGFSRHPQNWTVPTWITGGNIKQNMGKSSKNSQTFSCKGLLLKRCQL